MCIKKDKKDKVQVVEINADILEAKNIHANSIKIDGNFMIGEYTCNFVWNDDIGAYVLCGYKE